MSYVNARQNRKTEKIDVVERINGKRVYAAYPIDYSFYVSSDNGSFQSIYHTPLEKITPTNSGEFHKELNILKGKRLWESDVNYIYRCLADNYRHKPVPDLHIAFFDIEVAFDKDKGYSPAEDPFNPITSITILLHWTKQLITLAVPPPGMSMEKAQTIASRFDNTYIFESEIEMINTALDLFEDSDVISGWNSEGFDIPYLVNRISRLMSADDTRRLCLWGEKPKEKMIERFGKEIQTYELVGRTHLDLLDVYRKYTYEERHSYSLDAISFFELGKRKTPYSGSLDKLYRDDFEKFIEYNRQDVVLLGELEDKLRFISLLNDIAHDTTTLLSTCMGTVATIDQAILNRAHDLGFIVPNRNRRTENNENDGEDTEKAVGAYVAPPKSGIHQWVGVIDINSLYPSCIRALNMGLETIVGQIRPELTEQYISEKFKEKGMTYAKSWEGQFGTQEYLAVMARKPGVELIIDWENTEDSNALTAAECYDLIFNSGQKWMISGNGTIFTYEREAIIPGLLAQWYKQRKEFQKQKKEATTAQEAAFFDRRQLVQKILLNSLYGALLSQGSRFYDKRLGQSVTLCGRVICKHLNSFVNECITGTYAIDGDAVIAADTDSISADSFIDSTLGTLTIEQLYNLCNTFQQINSKEYGFNNHMQVRTFDPEINKSYFENISYIYRHKVKKEKWEIEDEHGNKIEITNDHSIMIERNGKFIECKPSDLLETDLLISFTPD